MLARAPFLTFAVTLVSSLFAAGGCASKKQAMVAETTIASASIPAQCAAVPAPTAANVTPVEMSTFDIVPLPPVVDENASPISAVPQQLAIGTTAPTLGKLKETPSPPVVIQTAGALPIEKSATASPLKAEPVVKLAVATEHLPPPSELGSQPAQGSPEAIPVPPPLTTGSGAPNVVVIPGIESREVTMANILTSVAGRNPEVGYATQRYSEAYARLIAAKALWLPAINAGVGWNNHAGPLQGSDGVVNEAARSSLTAGLGVQTIGAGSPVVPGLFANFHSADAIFQPKIANRAAAARDAAIRTTINDLLMESALAYLELLRAYQYHAIAVDIRYHAEQLAKATADFAQAGEGTQADADRAATELSIRQNEVVRAEELIQVASAKLLELLNEDPRFVLRPLEPAIAPVDLVPLDVPVQALLPAGLTNRPELAEAQHLVGEAVHRYRLEKCSPWLPNVLMGTSYAGFGGGPGSQIDNTAGRFDMDAILYWQVRNLGAGEYAARREARARYDQTRFEQVKVMNQVSREIVESHAQVQARHRQIAISQQAVERAVASFDRNLARVHDLKGLPIETLQSIQALDQARREYLRALVDYNSAQFRLHRALGWPVDISDMDFQVNPPQGQSR
jgi:outer membrane protein TolC